MLVFSFETTSNFFFTYSILCPYVNDFPKCESMHSRNLQTKEWFCTGCTLFDIDSMGCVTFKEYGRNKAWKLMLMPKQISTKLAFVGQDTIDCRSESTFNSSHEQQIMYCPRGSEHCLSDDLIAALAKSSRGFNWRSNKGIVFGDEAEPIIPHHSYKLSHFYSRRISQSLEVNSMHVLGNGDGPVLLNSIKDGQPTGLTDVDSFVPDVWETLFKNVNNSLGCSDIGAGDLHMGVNDYPQMTAYSGHLDKKYFPEAIFLPLAGKFWTLVAVPQQNSSDSETIDSSQQFDGWMHFVSRQSEKRVVKFLLDFEKKAQGAMKCRVSVRKFLCEPGSLLKFPASNYYHATITPADEDHVCRILAVLHQIIPSSR